ncbi:subtilisin family serine protease [Streptosporangium album]|uniref:Subtilisin family serine protease n=1 Tax=Streptosporangium album TaxID=47479 RepID=A0A7W7WBX5_9ACTN|nr:S8 family serine peptidase [Streptosporangium album]MBB4940664.1 subtilisin family serine protease [Streptosporangium album]
MPGSKRRLRVSVVAAITIATMVPVTATYADPGTAQTPPAKDTVALDGVAPGPHEITLITGDTVTLGDNGGGPYSIDVKPANRPDGVQPGFLTKTGPGGVYVYPTDALPAVESGRVDRELFNVKYLAENGYTDAQSKQVPVLVQYPKGQRAARSAADALPATTATADLPSISGAGLRVDKAGAGQFWTEVRGVAAPEQGLASRALAKGVAKLWLDRKVHLTLADSVPLIGAPQAWAAGLDGTGVKVAVLDTGVDTKHPDLADRIAASQSFVPGQELADGHGHGTHVASTIAGSGSASGGRNKGAAPGARLLVGKILDNAGNGDSSWVIDGMEWAASNGAKIVSMSIGAGVTDGGDPMSQAVNELTASTGALFVIAAGNSGPTPQTIDTPGAADAALTVAATSKTDTLAAFSSRGPRLDGALKPDIAAPGVNIVAARSAGTSMGSPADEYYTSASGTSMATPHVAGSAAILAQQHPDWTAAQYKAALMSTAKDDGFTVYEQGAGRVDVARATSQKVLATTPNLDFGAGPDGKDPVTRQVTYANLGDQPVTLTLTPTLSTGGKPVEGALSADQTLAVPAGGTATATVTLNPAGLDYGAFTGAVVAETDGIRITTPVGLYREAPKVTLTVKTIGRDGAPLTPISMDTIDVTGPYGNAGSAYVVDTGVVATRVPPGTYSVMQLAQWVDDDSRMNWGWLSDPEVDVTEDTTITLDLRKAGQVRFTTPRPAERLNNAFMEAYQRTTTDGVTFAGGLSHLSWDEVWATPTERVTKGRFRFVYQQTLGQAEVHLAVTGKPKLDLRVFSPIHWATMKNPDGTEIEDQNGFPGWTPFTGIQDLPVVNVGEGRPEDLAGLDLKGKLALMEAGMTEGIFGPVCGVQIERLQAVRDAGAAGLVAFPSLPSETMARCPVPLNITQRPFTGPKKDIGIPNVSLSAREGLALRDRIAEKPVSVRVTGTQDTPYTYAFKQYEEGRIPGSLHRTYTARQLAQVDVEHPASSPTTDFSDWRYSWKQDDEILWAESIEDGGHRVSAGPNTRRDYIGPLSAEILRLNFSSAGRPGSPRETTSVIDVYDQPIRTRQRMFAGPRTPGGYTAPDKVYRIPDPAAPYPATVGLNTPCDVCRRGNVLFPIFHTVRQNDGLQQHDDMYGIFRYTYRLSRDGVEIPLTPVRGFPAYMLPAEPATYRLTATDAQTDVAWTFTSAKPTKDTVQPGHICGVISNDPCRPESLVYVAYDLGSSFGADNAVPAGRKHTFTVNVSHGPSLEKMPEIAGLKLWASTDDGKQWTPVQVKQKKDGTFTATATYPEFDRTTGTVSLKAEAWDTAGNRVEQTTLKSFTLRAATGPR